MSERIDVAVKSHEHGKMVRARVMRVGTGADARVDAVAFSGDFFLEPAEVLHDLNAAMQGATLADAARRAEAFFADDRPMMLIGAGAGDFAAAVVKALETDEANS